MIKAGAPSRVAAEPGLLWSRRPTSPARPLKQFRRTVASWDFGVAAGFYLERRPGSRGETTGCTATSRGSCWIEVTHFRPDAASGPHTSGIQWAANGALRGLGHARHPGIYKSDFFRLCSDLGTVAACRGPEGP